MNGKIASIHGDVIEVEFSDGLPNINDLLTVRKSDASVVMLEVHDHTSRKTAKTIALSSTEGLKRDMTVEHSGGPLMVPACRDCLGRVFDIFGEPIDGKPLLEQYTLKPIHRQSPALEEQVHAAGILGTGIKIIDLLSPFPKGGKVGLFGGAGLGKTVLLMEFIYKVAKVHAGTSIGAKTGTASEAWKAHLKI